MYVGSTVAGGVSKANDYTSSKLEETGVSAKFREGYGYVAEKTGSGIDTINSKIDESENLSYVK